MKISEFRVGDLVKVTEKGGFHHPTGVGKIKFVGDDMVLVDLIYIIEKEKNWSPKLLNGLAYFPIKGEVKHLDEIKDKKLCDKVMAELI